jgi:outer membrane protein
VASASIRVARNDVQSACETQRALVESVLLDIGRAYWFLVFTQEDVLARRKSLEVATQLLEDEQARLEARVGTPLEVADALAGVEQRRGDLITAEGNRQAAEDVLRLLVMPFTPGGEAQLRIIAIDDAKTDRGLAPPGDDLDRYIQIALASRPEVLSGRAQLANRSIDVAIAANAVKPSLDLVASASSRGLAGGWNDALGEMFTGEALSGTIGVQFSMFIGQRAAKANLRIADWARRQAVLRQKDLENGVIADVRAALRDVNTARATLEAGTAQVAARVEGLEGERQRLAQGKSTPFRVLQKEQDLTEARLRVAGSASDLRTAEVSFWRAIGRLSEQLGVPICR